MTHKYEKSWMRRTRLPVKRMHIASPVQVTYASNGSKSGYAGYIEDGDIAARLFGEPA